MAESAPAVTAITRSPALPAEVSLFREDLAAPAFTPRMLRAIRDAYGRSFGELMADEHSDDRLVVIAWLKLQEAHGPFPLEAMDDVLVRLKLAESGEVASAPADPTESASLSSSSDSAEPGA